MKEKMKTAPETENCDYGDGFPCEDNDSKVDDTTSRDPSRPFDSARKKSTSKEYNSSGTNMNEKNAFDKK